MAVKRSKRAGARSEALTRIRSLEEQVCTLGLHERLRQAFARLSLLEEQMQALIK